MVHQASSTSARGPDGSFGLRLLTTMPPCMTHPAMLRSSRRLDSDSNEAEPPPIQRRRHRHGPLPHAWSRRLALRLLLPVPGVRN